MSPESDCIPSELICLSVCCVCTWRKASRLVFVCLVSNMSLFLLVKVKEKDRKISKSNFTSVFVPFACAAVCFAGAKG